MNILSARPRLVATVVGAFLLAAGSPTVRAHELTFDERVEAQRAIERVYWNHRIWPKENPGTKPALSAVMSDEAIRDRVEDYLRKSAAFASYWQDPLTGERLQAEMDRMARDSHDPQVLNELFEALGNDPFLVAETLARQTLADRLIGAAFAHDERIHGDLRRKAEAAFATCRAVPCMKSMNGEYNETTIKRIGNAAWDDQLDRLARGVGGTPRSLRKRQLSGIEETDETFAVTTILSQSPSEVAIATVTWRKIGFTTWWSAQGPTLGTEVAAASDAFVLPAAPSTGCVNDTWSRTRLDIPDPRQQAKAVWTGTEMIVWGGSDGANGNLNTGGRYNPSTDTWLATSTGTNVPGPRSLHSAIWTGTEMIVWGGAFSNTGGRYNPSTDTWVATSVGAGVPEGRGDHTAVWTGTEMIVWGGNSALFLNTGGRYNPSTDTWVATSTGTNVPLARYLHSAVWTGSVMIVWGGQANGATQDTGARYDPSSNNWTPIATGPTARISHTAVWTGTVMIVYGGNNTSGVALNSGGRYDPGANTWTSTSTGANVPSARTYNSTVWTGTEMIVWGGNVSGSGPVNNGGRYNPTSNTWLSTSTGANVPAIRFYHSAVWTGTEMIVWGGQSPGPVLNTGSRYNPTSNTWVAMTAGTFAPSARTFHTSVWTGTEMIIWGGFLFTPNTAFNTGGRYVPATDTWVATSTGASVPAARRDHKAIWTGTEMIVWGGQNQSPSYVNSGGRYNPTTDTWTPTSTGANVPPARSGHAAVWSGTKMIVWGGYGNTGRLNTGGRYDPATDTWAATSTGANVPLGRGDHSAVWAGTELIVWGGSDTSGPAANTGGRYNPSTDNWQATSTGANVPAARYGHPAVWTGTEMIVWGGYNGSTYLNSGGRYNPSSNTWLATSTAAGVPSPRFFNTAVWTGTEMIVWGGSDSVGYFNSGARYTPASNSWTPTSTAGQVPSPRWTHTATWTGAEMIVWGGLPTTATGGRYCACPSGTLAYRDADGDGYGNPGVTTSACDGSIPAGYVSNSGDCNDADGAIHPGATELVADAVDQNCDGGELCYADGDHDSYGTASTVASSDVDCADSGEATNTTDCNDGNPGVHPGAVEICNGLDDNCDTTTDNGGAALCGDANPCTDDACNGVSGCGHVNNSNPCNDGSACTLGDTCAGGTCGGTPAACDDGNPCTDDSCNPGSGCLHANNTAACDDGSLCTTGDTCGGGTCTGTPVVCNDGNVCTVDTCSPATGLCVYTGGDCVIDVDPPDDTIDVGVSTNVTLTYLDPIDPATVTASTFRLIGPGEVPVPATIQVSTSGTRPTLDPTAALEPDTIYRVETTSGILGPGAIPTQPFTSYFRTGAATASTEIPTISQPTSTLPTLAQGGASVSRAGDLNGDGIQDVLSGAPGYAAGGAFALGTVAESGAVLVYFGSTIASERAVPDIVFEGVDAHDRVGVSVAGDFDFNGDGLRDIVIGAEQVDRATDPDNPTPTGKGKVYLIFFDPSDTVHYPNIADPAVPDFVSLALVGQPGGVPGVVFEGVAFGDQAGFSVAGGGTSTLSAGTDIVIGAPGADPGSRNDAGSVYVVFDSATLSGTVSLSLVSDGLPDQIDGKAYLGESGGDLLGFSTVFAGAIIEGQDPTTGTVLMGAPGAAGAIGRLIAPPGDPDTTPIIVDAIGSTQSGVQILGTQPGEQLGWSVADGGDALADGIPDVLIGAPTYDVGGQTDAGRVLETTQVLTSGIYSADAVGTTISGTIWTGEAAGDQLGSAVDGTSDVTGDEFDDVVLGAPYVDPLVGGVPQTDAGAVYVVNGAPAADNLGTHSVTEIGDTIAGEELTGTEPGEHAGSSIAGSGDVSGDGENDFAVGAPAQNNDAGTVYLVLLEAPPPVGSCGPSGCQLADFATGAEIDVPSGALGSSLILGVTGIVDAGALPAPVPAGKMLLGAAEFSPDGQIVSSPFATIYIPTGQPLAALLAPSEVIPLFYYNGSAWVPAGVDGTTGPNPTYPARLAISAVVGVLHVYAAFLNDADSDGVRDELDNCPTIANPTQLDTNGDDIGDACQCVNVSCSDGNVCTDDNCSPATGCFNTNNVASCEDGDPCTAGDVCGGGSCQTGTTITAPPEAQSVTASSDKVTFNWTAALYATSYDVVRGLTSGLAVGPGGGDEVCFNNLAGTTLLDSSVPASGNAFWYLARGDNACGAGSYGLRSNGSPRLTTTCP